MRFKRGETSKLLQLLGHTLGPIILVKTFLQIVAQFILSNFEGLVEELAMPDDRRSKEKTV